jgi:phospholipase/lecithinase/hemolysin
VKNLYLFTLGFSLLATTAFPAKAALSSLYVFGDGLSATDDNIYPSPGYPDYFGLRWSNGQVWVEVLAQLEGIPINYNNSYFEHNSSLTLANVKSFTAPPNVANDLFIVWVCNADTFDAASTVVSDNNQNPTHLLNGFISANIQSQANHLQIITNLYAKGVRNLILPNAVDISKIPAYNTGNIPIPGVLQAGCIDYNSRFVTTLNQAQGMCPSLKIYTPDYFTLLNNVLTNAAYYGLTNAKSGGLSIDALEDLYATAPVNLNGAGTNYIFWDPKNPTAKLHAVMANVAQQLISPPVQVGNITPFADSRQWDVVHYPVGAAGLGNAFTQLTLTNRTDRLQLAGSNTAPLLVIPTSRP